VLIQIVEALVYVHNVEQYVHMNVSPQSIVVTKRGMWKLAGFAFAVSSNPDQQHSSVRPAARHNKIAQSNLGTGRVATSGGRPTQRRAQSFNRICQVDQVCKPI